MHTYLVSRYSSIPYRPPSLPIPLCFIPPKGAMLWLMMPSLMPIIPASRESASLHALAKLLVQAYAANPNLIHNYITIIMIIIIIPTQ